MEAFTSPQVCRLTGVTYRELDYWVRTGTVAPTVVQAHGSGTQRRFSPSDVEAVAIVASLRAAGVPLVRCGRAVASARYAEAEARWLVVEGGSVQVLEDGVLEAALVGSDGAVVVDLAAVRRLVPLAPLAMAV